MAEVERVIYVDADAVPKRALIAVFRRAKEYRFRVITVSSINHLIESEHHITVDAESQATDMKIVGLVRREIVTVVITQDYGLAALVLGKGAYALSPSGMEYTEANIDRLLFERALHAAERRASGRTKGPKARSSEDEEKFDAALVKILSKARKLESK